MPRRYGKVGVVAFEDAQRAFIGDLAARPADGKPALKPELADVTPIDLISDFLKWVQEHRGQRAYVHRHHQGAPGTPRSSMDACTSMSRGPAMKMSTT